MSFCKSSRLLGTFLAMRSQARGLKTTRTLGMQENIRYVAGSNKAPKYRRIDPEKKLEELAPVFFTDQRWRDRLINFAAIILFVKYFFKNENVELIRGDMALLDFEAAELEKQSRK